jgi:hypothetical protein
MASDLTGLHFINLSMARADVQLSGRVLASMCKPWVRSSHLTGKQTKPNKKKVFQLVNAKVVLFFSSKHWLNVRCQPAAVTSVLNSTGTVELVLDLH